jgi:hypothetical protein
MRAARLVWSDNGWTYPQGGADHGVDVNSFNPPYRYGLEEFLFNKELLKLKIGYLDCYRYQTIQDIEDVLLFAFSPTKPRQIIVIGKIHQVQQIQDQEKVQIWNDLNQLNYLDQIVNPAFRQIEGIENNQQANGTNIFIQNNYGNAINNLPLIHGAAPNGFMVNLKYEEIEYYPEGHERRINLSNIDPGINNAWKRLTVLYYVQNRPLIVNHFLD